MEAAAAEKAAEAKEALMMLVCPCDVTSQVKSQVVVVKNSEREGEKEREGER